MDYIEKPRAYESTKENRYVDSKECEERSERRDRNRTEKGTGSRGVLFDRFFFSGKFTVQLQRESILLI